MNKKIECNICDVIHWFVDCYFEARSLHFGCRYLGILEPEVTIMDKPAELWRMTSLSQCLYGFNALS